MHAHTLVYIANLHQRYTGMYFVIKWHAIRDAEAGVKAVQLKWMRKRSKSTASACEDFRSKSHLVLPHVSKKLATKYLMHQLSFS